MIKECWINLPVKDIGKSKAFFSKLGFPMNTRYGDNDHSASLLIGQHKIVVMLFDEPSFKGFTGKAVADAEKATEVLLSIGVESKEQVDEMAEKAVAAGGKSDHKPTEMKGWMYGCVFSDLDGHQWNVMYMDMAGAPDSAASR